MRKQGQGRPLKIYATVKPRALAEAIVSTWRDNTDCPGMQLSEAGGRHSRYLTCTIMQNENDNNALLKTRVCGAETMPMNVMF